MLDSTLKPATATRPTLDAMVAFIKANLVKSVTSDDGTPFLALAETAVRFNDTSWFWTDDNAKAAELLVEPAYFDADPTTANAAIDFVLRMSAGDIIGRRWGPAEFRVLSTDPAAFRFETAFFIIEGDLTKGVVRHSLRFNDGRTVTAAQHTANAFTARHKGRSVVKSVEKSITAYHIEARDRSATISYAAAIHRPRRWGSGPGLPLGTLTYAYTLSADLPTIALDVSFTANPGIALDAVTLSTAYDQLTFVPGLDYRAIGIRAAGQDTSVRDVPSRRTDLHAGPASSTVIAQEGASPGFSYGIHTLMPDGAKLAAITARGQHKGRLHWILHRYDVGRVDPGQTVRVHEKRMLTGGGYYDALAHYAHVMETAAGAGGADPSMTYDIGAELNAVAAHILFARTGQYAHPPSEARLAQLTTWFDRHAARYFAFIRPDSTDAIDRVFTRGIAYVVTALDCMLRATADARYATMMDTAAALILRMLRPEPMGRDTTGGTFGDTWAGLVPFLDNHSACILALTRAAYHGNAATLGKAVNEAVLGIRLYTGVMQVNPEHAEAYDGIATLNIPERGVHADPGFWNFKTGVTLRAMHAIQRAADDGVLPLSAIQRRRVELRISLCEQLLQASCRWHGDALEVLTSIVSGETNSETQPWIALGLVPVVDERIVTLGHRRPS